MSARPATAHRTEWDGAQFGQASALQSHSWPCTLLPLTAARTTAQTRHPSQLADRVMTHVSLEGHGLRVLPPKLFEREDLMNLNLSCNQIDDLTNEIGWLQVSAILSTHRSSDSPFVVATTQHAMSQVYSCLHVRSARKGAAEAVGQPKHPPPAPTVVMRDPRTD